MAKTTDGVNTLELDKFKRRMIRSVARLLIHEKKPEEKVWQEMKKETSCDCKVLWQRMRILTIKKLKRLLAADDRLDSIPTVAQMTLTDWLIFDLVIVHDKVDMIGQDKITANNSDSKALMELFTLVQRFNIEGRQGQSLAEAWTAATVLYNTQGHQCSPMLMQRRWYQLKELTRSRFYKFWFTYRGNARQLAKAEEFTPSRLQRAIAKRYPNIITSPFLDWEEMIEKKLVIMPEEFEDKMRIKNLPKPCDENASDLVLLEPVIETIDLGQDSDSDYEENEASEATSDNTETNVILIKNEPDDLNTHDICENINEIPEEITKPQQALKSVEQEELLFDNDNINDDIKNCIAQENNIMNAAKSYETKVTQRVSEDRVPDDSPASFDRQITDESQEVIPKITSIFGSIDITKETLSQISSLTQAQMVPEIQCQPTVEKTNHDQIIDLEYEENIEIKKGSELQLITQIEDDKVAETNYPIAIELEQEIAARAENYISQSKIKENNVGLFGDTSMELDFDDNGIEFVDDGIEYVDEDELLKNNGNDVVSSVKMETKGGDSNESVKSLDDTDETHKFDLKLLMYPVVYTTKLDHMDVFNEFMSFDNVSDKNLIESIAVESKPVSQKVVSDIEHNGKDLILCDDGRIHDDLFQLVTSSDENSNSSEEEIDESRRVKLSSYLLQKPRSRSYNSIQLCKNPDFNTRLKRLPVGFFSSSRNRFLLKSCKPMTIDVTKAFESKLIDSTLYLKGTDKPVVVIDDKDNINKTASVLPSAMAVQSLIDNTNLKDVLVSSQNLYKMAYPNLNPSPSDDSLERNKVINLPDIKQVRRINQRLLTAEVPPIRVENSNTVYKALEITNVIQTPTSKIEPVSDIELNTTDNEVNTTLITCNNDADIRNIVSLTNDGKKIVSMNRENTPPPNLASDKDTPIETLKIQQLTTPTSLAFPIETDHIINSNLEVNKYRAKKIERCNSHVNDIASNPTKENSSHVENSKAFVNSAHETHTNDVRKDRSFGYQPPKYKAPMWRPLIYNRKAPISWLTKPKYGDSHKVEDSLLTLDTLNKMLMVISGPNEKETPAKKAKKVTKANSPVLKQLDVKDTNKNETTKTRKKKMKKPKITISHANKSNKSNPTYKGKYCCWARDQLVYKKNKIVRREFKHACPVYNCICCCKEALAQTTAIVLSDDEDVKLKNACDSIESVVQRTQDVVSKKKKNNKSSVFTMRRLSNRNATRRSIGTDPMEYNDRDKSQESKEISRTVWTISMNLGHLCRPSREAGNMVDMEMESPDVIFPQTDNRIHHSDEIELISAPIAPVTSPRLIDYAMEKLPSPAATQSHINQPDRSTLKTCSPAIISTHREITPDIRPMPNISLNSPKRQLVIDGSKNFRIDQDFQSKKYICSPQNRVLYLKRKMKPTSSPIYLGKNKILLTNVKFPREIQNSSQKLASEIPITPKPLPVMAIPNGVQLVLQTNGQLTFIVDPEAQIEPQQLSILPEILAAVQQQLALNSSVAAPTASALNNNDLSTTELGLTGNVVHDNTATAALSNSTNVLTNEEENTAVQIEPNNADKLGNTKENVTGDTGKNMATGSNDMEKHIVSHYIHQYRCQQQIQYPNSTKNNSIENNSEGDTIDVNIASKSIDNNIKEFNRNSDNEMPNTNRKSLLSDLMQMSGISTEDAKTPLSLDRALQDSKIPVSVSSIVPPEMSGISSAVATISLHTEQVLQESNISIPVPDLAPLKISSIPAVDVKAPGHAESFLHESNRFIPVPDLIPIDKGVPPAHVNPETDMPELSPVTSFIQLKYACDHNGLFFKLDFETGVIVPINVCIKKNLKNSQKNKMNVANLAPKGVIDLTEEIDFPSDDQASEKNMIGSEKKMPLILTKMSTGINKNVKPVKLFKTLHSRSLLRRETMVTHVKTDSITDRDEIRDSTYSNNRKRKQDLNNIEANIDLVDSDGCIEEEYLMDSSNSDLNEKTSQESDDSSDDEPLIMKAKRKKNLEECTQEKELSKNTETTVNKGERDNAAVESETMTGEFEKPDDVIMDDSANDGPVELHFVNSDGDDDDCILGV